MMRIITHRGPFEMLAQGVQDIDELRLAPTADVDDKQGIYVEDERSLYFFEHGSVEAESLPDVVAPTAGDGRWVRHGHGAGGTPSELYRPMWQQPQVVESGDAVTIEADHELIIETIVVDGDLDVQGTLMSPGDNRYRPTFSQPMTIPADTGESIPPGDQLIVSNTLTVDGHLDVRGDLLFINV